MKSTIKKYEGFCADKNFHIKKGDKVQIKKGTRIKSTHPDYDEKIASKNQIVTVNHLLNGVSLSPLTPDTKYYGITREQCEERMNEFRAAIQRGEKVTEMDFAFHVKNPSVVWAGAGSYWHEVDINEVEKVD